MPGLEGAFRLFRDPNRFPLVPVKRNLSIPATTALLCSALTCVMLSPARAAGDASPAPAPEADKPLSSEVVKPLDGPGSLDFPRRKPGLWEIRSSASEQLGLPPVVLCVGPDTDTAEHHLDRRVGKRGACQLGGFRRVGINWMADSTCRDSRTRIVSQSIANGDFQTHYRIDTVVFYSPPLPNNKREDRESTSARYLRSCPDNSKPGDLNIPGMGILNMLDGALRAEPAAGR